MADIAGRLGRAADTRRALPVSMAGDAVALDAGNHVGRELGLVAG